MSPDKLSELYSELKEKYKEDPEGILQEYKEKYQSQERFIRYARATWFVLALLIIGISFRVMDWFFISSNKIVASILSLLLGIILTAIYFRFNNVNSAKFPNYEAIKGTYKDAYLHSQYTQFTLKAKREEIESKWMLLRWWRERKFYGI